MTILKFYYKITREHYIKHLNHLGKNGAPFLFVIDFEMEKPLIFTKEEWATSGIQFDFPNGHLLKEKATPNNAPLYFNVDAPSYSDYLDSFNKVQKALHFGDSYLCNLTFPSKINTDWSLEDIFHNSKAPYRFLLANEFTIFSPEPFIKISNNQIATFPMKGTIAADIPNAKSVLKNNPKEKAEHATVVDLLRNDLSQIAKNVSVNHYRYMGLIQNIHGDIWQSSSKITGQLPENWPSLIGEYIYKLLPAGSISGAPKMKTVNIIQDAEIDKRGYYTGIVVYFDGKSLESCVAIRYIEQKDGQKYFRSGGGITVFSQAEEEYKEMIQKIYLPLRGHKKAIHDK